MPSKKNGAGSSAEGEKCAKMQRLSQVLSKAVDVSVESVGKDDLNKCFGEIAIGIQLVLEWIAMGCFFITIITTVMICSDLEGVPNHLLLLHLQRPSVSTVYDLPALTTWIGVIFYGIWLWN